METSARQMLQLLLESQALTFGQFTLKSGRQSPYFVNLGGLCSGRALTILGEAYAEVIMAAFGGRFDVVFGPAYKGIPIAVAACEALWRRHGVAASYAADRKEEKDHGDRGLVVGAKLGADTRVVYVDDVISAGTSMRNTMHLFNTNFGCKVIGAVVAVDRQERGTSSPVSAVQEVERTYGVKVHAILRMRAVVDYLHATDVGGTRYIDDRLRDEIDAYLRRYGSE
ncbi:MAG TPA: orotate phosphoribosyltransferase [Planctomycetota bacterium]|jgi:orotate phosphoribosyltransferase|nr:orotate phosphoribosyltransferase [Planctomycetota bacterium]HNR98953.1 orotate phosphoribosyltransferase [Planctomycetota bacterium]HNU27127.1 orotate phosphoribosyltransferase [Planctomycetota bacterium]HOE30293.1 orotate phosphoribosyltransferase [Planctomycetota bacterium]HOE87237.1 orotate phosphoribosyltransferase [Planctomycetota bacterium]